MASTHYYNENSDTDTEEEDYYGHFCESEFESDDAHDEHIEQHETRFGRLSECMSEYRQFSEFTLQRSTTSSSLLL